MTHAQRIEPPLYLPLPPSPPVAAANPFDLPRIHHGNPRTGRSVCGGPGPVHPLGIWIGPARTAPSWVHALYAALECPDCRERMVRLGMWGPA